MQSLDDFNVDQGPVNSRRMLSLAKLYRKKCHQYIPEYEDTVLVNNNENSPINECCIISRKLSDVDEREMSFLLSDMSIEQIVMFLYNIFSCLRILHIDNHMAHGYVHISSIFGHAMSGDGYVKYKFKLRGFSCEDVDAPGVFLGSVLRDMTGLYDVCNTVRTKRTIDLNALLAFFAPLQLSSGSSNSSCDLAVCAAILTNGINFLSDLVSNQSVSMNSFVSVYFDNMRRNYLLSDQFVNVPVQLDSEDAFLHDMAAASLAWNFDDSSEMKVPMFCGDGSMGIGIGPTSQIVNRFLNMVFDNRGIADDGFGVYPVMNDEMLRLSAIIKQRYPKLDIFTVFGYYVMYSIFMNLATDEEIPERLVMLILGTNMANARFSFTDRYKHCLKTNVTIVSHMIVGGSPICKLMAKHGFDCDIVQRFVFPRRTRSQRLLRDSFALIDHSQLADAHWEVFCEWARGCSNAHAETFLRVVTGSTKLSNGEGLVFVSQEGDENLYVSVCTRTIVFPCSVFASVAVFAEFLRTDVFVMVHFFNRL